MKKSTLPLQTIRGSDKLISGKEALIKLLRWHFGHPEFRDKQLEAIHAVLSGRDCFCLMPTGGGKSMCYQIPALAKTGIVLVVCPLIALMENQVIALKKKGIAAEYLSSTQTLQVRNKIHEDLDCGKPSVRLLYVTPELIATQGFMCKLTKIHARGLLSLIAIDEAHCISTWGHDFRPSYRKLSSLRNHLPDIPILALTATAVPKVQEDVINSLNLQEPLVLKSSFNRPNIYYEVRYKDLLKDAYADLCEVLHSSGDICTIVYCLERTTCDELSAHLSKNGISCAAYHAGLNNKLRSSVLDDWLSSKIQVVVATVAFGMGIDRKDVRMVCHYNIPKSMEAFYQESGRAGRDQLNSRSILYYGMDDRRRMEFILSNSERKKLQSSSSQDGLSKKSISDFHQMVEYCEGSGCRRKKILESFGEQVPASLCKESCDACKNPKLVSKHLEELATTSALGQRNSFSQIMISSSTDMFGEGQFSEFWNRDDEANGSEEDISDCDDCMELVDSVSRSQLSKRLQLEQRMELLERAEESYYHKQKQVNKNNKNAISETLREGSRQKLLAALTQAQERLGVEVEFDSSSALLENECYNKYGKSGKSFYYSQVASTIRWLSTTSSGELMNRLGGSTKTPPSEKIMPRDEPPVTVSAWELRQTEHVDDLSGYSRSATSGSDASLDINTPSKRLPVIPSFSEFINSRKPKNSQTNSLQKLIPRSVNKKPEKRMRLQ